MRPPYTISNSESQTSFASPIFSEGMGGGSVHRLGITSKEESEITNSVQIYTLLKNLSRNPSHFFEKHFLPESLQAYSLPRSRFLDVMQCSPKRAGETVLHDIQKMAARETAGLNDAFQSPVGVHKKKAKKEKRKKGNKMDGGNRCMGKFGDFRATFYF